MRVLRAPWPYFGSKRWAAREIWRRLGDLDVYSEPFFGSGAVLLRCPKPARREVITELDGLVVNFWRAVKLNPERVAELMAWPRFHADVTARRAAILEWRSGANLDVMMRDPDWFDPLAAGWWGFVRRHWIGEIGETSWSDRRPRISSPIGHVSERMPAVADLLSDLRRLQERLANVTILHRDWRAAVTRTVLSDTISSRPVRRGIFLDPPYPASGRRRPLHLYGADSLSMWPAVAAWAVRHGERYAIALAGPPETPRGWTTWRAGRRPDAIHFSPLCLP